MDSSQVDIKQNFCHAEATLTGLHQCICGRKKGHTGKHYCGVGICYKRWPQAAGWPTRPKDPPAREVPKTVETEPGMIQVTRHSSGCGCAMCTMFGAL